jgi:rod shape-determining protein MreC
MMMSALSVVLIIGSAAGLLGPLENIAVVPLNALAGFFGNVTSTLTRTTEELAEIQTLRDRNAELEEALTVLQSEVVELREIASDYQRLSNLLEYQSTALNQEVVAAEVIAYDESSFIRSMVINRGSRDGIAEGMPVVTNQGLVGRITDVIANASRVMLVTDPNSAISARLQTSRAQGSVVGQLTGNLRMIMIPLEAEVQEGDLVITSGLGGNFPADLVIGQVTSTRQFEFELNQTAEVRSLIDFDSLEIVLVVTNFQPVDLSTFEEQPEQ